VTRHLVRLLPLCILALTFAGAGPALAGPKGASCCKVTYNAAKTHVQVTGTVAYKGEPILFSFHGPCASPAGPGLASVKSRWIPVKDLVAGYHRIEIVQRVNGKIVFSSSPKFFIKGKARLREPTVTITSGPKGAVTSTSALFKFKGSNLDRLECRLDNRKWQFCGAGWAKYENLAPGTHVFTVRAYSLDGKSHVDAKRTFTVSAAPPGG
jgi:hypothetical protein